MDRWVKTKKESRQLEILLWPLSNVCPLDQKSGWGNSWDDCETAHCIYWNWAIKKMDNRWQKLGLTLLE